MAERRYILVLLDSTGRNVRRLTLERRSLQLGVGIAGALGTVLVLLGIHGTWAYAVARETRQLRQDNRALSRTLHSTAQQLEEMRTTVYRSELALEQLWSKSDLGAGTREQLSDGANPPTAEGSTESTATAMPEFLSLTDHCSESLAQLTDRCAQIGAQGRALERALGETAEYFYDAEQLLANTPSIRPARTPWLTSSFGKRRHPIFHYWLMHKGLDMAGHIGMKIVAPADGVVIWTGTRGGYGQTVVIDHGYGLQTHFAHLSRYRVHRGDHVRRGDLIAEMGSTGHSTGPHLHYEVRRLGQPLDPRRFILD